MKPADLILRKALVASRIDSSRWESIRADLRNRAFFSAQVESVRFLHDVREKIAEAVDSAKTKYGTFTTRQDAIAAVQADARRLAGELKNIGKGGLTDVSSFRRAKLVVETNAALAAGHFRHILDNQPGALAAFPAKELVRAPASHPRNPRDWTARWTAKGGKLFQDRMIALVNDPIWSALSRFGSPYPPFDYNSGMVTVSVPRDECIALGVVDADYKPPENSRFRSFNDGLEVPFEGNTDEWQRLKSAFGDQITHENGVIKWRGSLVRRAFSQNEPFNINLGKPTEALKACLTDEMAARLKDKTFTLKSDWLDKTRKDGSTHRHHFEPEENDPRNIPLTDRDLELIPVIWRSPDRVLPGDGKAIVICELDAFDGGVYRLIVDISRVPYLRTFYKKRV